MKGSIPKLTYMMKVKVHDIVFFGYIANDSDGDYINEDMYNLIKSRQHPFVFRETDRDLPKYKSSTGKAMKLNRLVVLPFEVPTTKKTIVLHHEILVVRSDSYCSCIFGIPFLNKIGISYSATINEDTIQIGEEQDDTIQLWPHKDDEQQELAVSIYHA